MPLQYSTVPAFGTRSAADVLGFCDGNVEEAVDITDDQLRAFLSTPTVTPSSTEGSASIRGSTPDVPLKPPGSRIQRHANDKWQVWFTEWKPSPSAPDSHTVCWNRPGHPETEQEALREALAWAWKRHADMLKASGLITAAGP